MPLSERPAQTVFLHAQHARLVLQACCECVATIVWYHDKVCLPSYPVHGHI